MDESEREAIWRTPLLVGGLRPTRGEIRERLFAAVGITGNEDRMTLAWSPIRDHDFWVQLVGEVAKIVAEARVIEASLPE